MLIYNLWVPFKCWGLDCKIYYIRSFEAFFTNLLFSQLVIMLMSLLAFFKRFSIGDCIGLVITFALSLILLWFCCVYCVGFYFLVDSVEKEIKSHLFYWNLFEALHSMLESDMITCFPLLFICDLCCWVGLFSFWPSEVYIFLFAYTLGEWYLVFGLKGMFLYLKY